LHRPPVGDDEGMSDKRTNKKLEAEELEQDGEALPDREVMSVITPEPVDGGIVLPVTSEDEEIFVYPRDPRTSS
jgi:hypothetical protein